MKTTFARLSLGIVLSIILFWVWYSVAADYGYSAVAGTYTLQQSGEISTLVLRPDRSFQQEVTRAGKVDRAQGSWRRIGEGGIVFSKEFLKVAGQEVRSDGEADGQVEKRCLGLLFSITLNPDPGGPTFRKKLFR
ncbi:MAG: hypothetical protein WAN65_02485 [Candidatus Sulfotelmatobacter sp.]